MATLIDALIVTLGLDTKEYDKGTKKAEKELDEFDKKRANSDKKNAQSKSKAAKDEERQHKEQQTNNKATVEALGQIRNQMLGVMGVFTAGKGFLDFAKSNIDAAANVGRLSENAGMAVNEIAGLDQALSRIGGSAEEAQSTIGMLGKELAKQKMGLPSNFMEFAQMGGETSAGGFKSTKEYLLAISDLLAKINKQDPSKAWMAAGRMGISDNVFNLLKQGRVAVEAQIAAGAQLSGMNKKQADEAREAQKAWADMASLLASIGKSILFPILQSISDWTKDHQKDIRQWLEDFRKFMAQMTPATIEKLKDAFVKVGETIDKISDSLAKMASMMNALGLGGSPEVEFSATKAAEQAQINQYWSRRQAAHQGTAGANTVNSGNSVHIGNVNVQTRATDANGIAAGIGGALQQHALAHQTNAGVR